MIGACKSRVASAFFVNVLRVGMYKNLGEYAAVLVVLESCHDTTFAPSCSHVDMRCVIYIGFQA